MISILSAGCVLWLQRLQPVFAAVAIGALALQTSLVFKRPAHLRTRRVMLIWGSSLGVCVFVFATWVALWLRYR
jgi:hypothetical protein